MSDVIDRVLDRALADQKILKELRVEVSALRKENTSLRQLIKEYQVSKDLL